MKINQNIKDAIKASVAIIVIVVMTVVGIEVYNTITYPEVEEVYGFIKFAQILHDDLDDNEVRDDVINLIDDISVNQTENYQEIDSLLISELRVTRGYKDRFYMLVSPTDEMRTLKKSLIEEGNLFLSYYSYLRKALESKIDNDYDAYLLNKEAAMQYFDNAMNLRIQNKSDLNLWRIRVETELSR